MRIVNGISRLMQWLFGDKNPTTLTTNEVNRALIDDSPRVVRVTLWAILLFFIRHDYVGLAGANRRSDARRRARHPLLRLQKVAEPGGRDRLRSVRA